MLIILQLMQEVQTGVHGNEFSGTPYVPVYMMLAVSGFFFLLQSLLIIRFKTVASGYFGSFAPFLVLYAFFAEKFIRKK